MRISKRLSANDVGATGTHQAGILVPKDPDILSFFPRLPADHKNPRIVLPVRELASGERWEFNFIHYNNKHFDPRGTRDEYRLTGTTRYLRAIAAEEGDSLEFSKDENGSVNVRLLRKGGANQTLETTGRLVLRGGWHVVRI